MEITSVERNKKNKDRMSIYLDGKYALSISEDDFLSMNLYDRMELNAEELEYIKNSLNFRAAKSTAIRYLSLRLRTEKEIRVKLQETGYDSENIEKVIDELKAIGYINNKLYAQKYVFDRSKLKPKSKKLLRLELQSRGISGEIADEVLEDWKIDESVVAEGLVKKKFGKYDLTDEKIANKIYMFLKHRGYNNDTIEGVMERLGKE